MVECITEVYGKEVGWQAFIKTFGNMGYRLHHLQEGRMMTCITEEHILGSLRLDSGEHGLLEGVNAVACL